MILLSPLDFSLPLKNPVIIFSLVLFIILFAPILFNKIKVPHIIGLIIAGVLIGPYGFNLLKRDSSMVLFGTVGLLYIMFLAGLEIDLAEFKKNRKKIAIFGVLTFLLPLACGTLASYYILGFSPLSSLLLASMFSTHTLVSYPIAGKYGVTRNRAIAMTVGGTMITDILALLILAGIAGTTKGETSAAFWIRLGFSSVVFVVTVLFAFPLLIRWFFKHFEDSVSQYIFVLAVVFLASFLAEAAGLEAIIGAFFSGLVLNKFVPHTSPLMNRVNFVGNALFIPFFLIGVGMLVDVTVFAKGVGALKVAGVIITVAIVTKYLAAWLTQKIVGLTRTERRIIFGLSSSHAAATLAIILVGYNIITGETATGEPIRLLNEDVLNGTILLILVSCGVGSFVTERAAKQLALAQEEQAEDTGVPDTEKILVSLAYPDLVNDLVDFATLLQHRHSAPIYGLHVVADDLAGQAAGQGRKILDMAVTRAAASDHTLLPLSRYDSSISNGIVYTIKEYHATDVVIGLHKQADQDNFLGAKTEHILKRVFDTVYIYKPTQPLNTLKRMVVAAPPQADTEPGFLRWLQKLVGIARESSMELLFYADVQTLASVKTYVQRKDSSVQASFSVFTQWDDFLIFSRELQPDDLFVIVSSRKGYNSHIPQLNKTGYYLSNYFASNSFLIIYPEQLESGINMGDIQQADSALIESISEQIGSISKAGRYLRNLFKGKKED
jgi:Kef-type K+ transport system membrane component KefB